MKWIIPILTLLLILPSVYAAIDARIQFGEFGGSASGESNISTFYVLNFGSLKPAVVNITENVTVPPPGVGGAEGKTEAEVLAQIPPPEPVITGLQSILDLPLIGKIADLIRANKIFFGLLLGITSILFLIFNPDIKKLLGIVDEEENDKKKKKDRSSR